MLYVICYMLYVIRYMLYVIAEVLCGQRAPTGAPWVRKFGNLVIREKWLGCQRTSVRPLVPRDSGGGGGGWESKGNPRGWRIPFFLGWKSRLAFGQPACFLVGNRMTIVAFEKVVSLTALTFLAKRFFESTEVLNFRKTSNIYQWKEKVPKNTQLPFGGRRKVQVTKSAFEDFTFAFFTTEILSCSKPQPSK